jgi:hypothetical protein
MEFTTRALKLRGQPYRSSVPTLGCYFCYFGKIWGRLGAFPACRDRRSNHHSNVDDLKVVLRQ